MPKDSTSNRRAKPSAVPLSKRHQRDGGRVTEPRGDEGWDLDPADVNAEYASMVERQLALLGEEPSREGLLKTPERVANAMAWLTRGPSRSSDSMSIGVRLTPSRRIHTRLPTTIPVLVGTDCSGPYERPQARCRSTSSRASPRTTWRMSR